MQLITNPEKATFLIPLSEIAIPRHIIEYAEQNKFRLKEELHVTLISFQNGKRISKALHDNPTVAFNDVAQLAESFKWGIILDSEYYVLERTIPEFILNGQVKTPKHTRRSIIQKVAVPNMRSFLEKLGEMLLIGFDMPFAHVTLFTWSDYEPESKNGIALNSEDDFKKYMIHTL